jgi:hypothetical protein
VLIGKFVFFIYFLFYYFFSTNPVSVTGAWAWCGGSWLGCRELQAMRVVCLSGAWLWKWKPLDDPGTHYPQAIQLLINGTFTLKNQIVKKDHCGGRLSFKTQLKIEYFIYYRIPVVKKCLKISPFTTTISVLKISDGKQQLPQIMAPKMKLSFFI